MFTWGSFLSTRQFCYKDRGQVSSGCRCLSLLRRVGSRRWAWNPGSASGWSKSKRRDKTTCHTIHQVRAPSESPILPLLLTLPATVSSSFRLMPFPHCIRVMARLLVLTSRLDATLPPPRNCRHHHQHSLPYSFTEHWAGQTYNKALLKVLYPMREARVTGPASSEAKQLVRLNQKDDSVLEAC